MALLIDNLVEYLLINLLIADGYSFTPNMAAHPDRLADSDWRRTTSVKKNGIIKYASISVFTGG